MLIEVKIPVTISVDDDHHERCSNGCSFTDGLFCSLVDDGGPVIRTKVKEKCYECGAMKGSYYLRTSDCLAVEEKSS